MTFLWPALLLSLLTLPLFVGLYRRQLRKRAAHAASLGSFAAAQNQAGRALGRRRHVSPVFYLGGLSLLLFGLARPEVAVSLPRLEGTVILAFDVSGSMLADDLEPSRLEAAKAAARIFVENQPNTILIGVVAFSNGGFVVQQPTSDQAAVLAAIERISPEGPTSLGQGLFTSLNAIAGEAISIEDGAMEEGAAALQIADYSSAVILLLSDGENTSSPDPLEIAQLAAEAGVRVYPIGIGSPDGAILNIEGYSILSQLNETSLQEIASVTNGTYYHAADEETLREIYENVDLQLTIGGEQMEITSLLAGASALLFLVGGLLSLVWFGRLP